MDFYYKEEVIRLLPEKAAFLPEHQMLVIADIHLGKASHFRKEGLMIPLPEASPDLQLLSSLIDSLRPATVVFLGDLFHSSLNKEWEALEDFLVEYAEIRFILTRGNHDILPAAVIEATSIELVEELILGEHLIFTHEPMTIIEDGKLNIAGHIHPGVLIKAKGRQSYRLPCFYYHNQCLILPAFGQLTGLYLLKEGSGVRIYPVIANEVIALS